MNRRFQNIGSTARRAASFLLTAAMTMMVGTACSDDDILTDNEEASTGEQRTATLEISMSPAVTVERTRGAEGEVAWDADVIDHVWIGVFETSTKRLIGAQRSDNAARYPNSSNAKFGADKKATVSFMYKDGADQQVFAVGLANYSGINAYRTKKSDENGNYTDESESPDGTPMLVDALLDEVTSWDDFLAISIDVESAEAMAKETGCRIMSNIVSSKNTQHPFNAGSENAPYDGKIYNKTSGGSTDDNGDEQITIKNDYSATRISGYLYLRRFLTHNNVVIKGGENVRIRNVRYKVFNVPRRTYLQERTTAANFSWSEASTLEEWIKHSPNAADDFPSDFDPATDTPTYYYDFDGGEVSPSATGGYKFEFYHYDNKHWGLKSGPENSKPCETYNQREVKFDNSELYKSLCWSEDMWYNNYATYFQIYATVTDLTTGNIADATYTIHEGYASSAQYGDLTGGTTGQRSRDFMALRNTDYTYNITIKSIKSIEIRVGLKEGTPDDAITGEITGVEFEFDFENNQPKSFQLTESQRKSLVWLIHDPTEEGTDGLTDFGTFDPDASEGAALAAWQRLSDWRTWGSEDYSEYRTAADADGYQDNDFYTHITFSNDKDGETGSVIDEFIGDTDEAAASSEEESKTYYVKFGASTYNKKVYAAEYEDKARVFCCYPTVPNAEGYQPMIFVRQYPTVANYPAPNIQDLKFSNGTLTSATEAIAGYANAVTFAWSPSIGSGIKDGESIPAESYTAYIDDEVVATNVIGQEISESDGQEGSTKISATMTLPSSVIQKLTARSNHTLSLAANADNYFFASEISETAPFYVHPTSLSWDFTTGNTWNLPQDETTIDETSLGNDLFIKGKLRYNTMNNVIQIGGTGIDHSFRYQALAKGVLEVTFSNTGSNSARNVAITVNDTETVSSISTSNTTKQTATFEIDIKDPTNVYIYPYNGGLRFYKIEYKIKE